MNPPSALSSAMSRDRKPFTYTPGGLDLSEIKSERMAKRLMRNAMNQGVPEVPVQNIQSPPMPSTPIAVPNYNCLPVQVFPTFNLPANPKSLLRTRSVTDQPRESPIQRVIPPSQFINNPNASNMEYYDTFNKNTPTYSQVNNNRPVSMYGYNSMPNNNYTLPRTNNGSVELSGPDLPEIRYEAEYLQAPRKVKTPVKMPSEIINDEKKAFAANESARSVSVDSAKIISEKTDPAPVVAKCVEDEAQSDQLQKEVKIVTTQEKKENKVEEQNGKQSEDGSVEAELVVKLPTKKIGAKTETKVEVVKKILPDGTVEEVKTTTTKTTIDGKTEIKTKTETRTLPKEETEEEIEEIEEEEEEEESGETVLEEVENDKEADVEEPVTTLTVRQSPLPKENGHDDNCQNIVKTEERSETTTTSTKKVVIVQDELEEQDVEEEEVEEEKEVEDAEPVTVVIKKTESSKKTVEEQVEVEVEESEETEAHVDKTGNEPLEQANTENDEQEEEKEEINEEKEEISEEKEEMNEEETEATETVIIKKQEPEEEEKLPEDDEEEVEEEEEYEEAREDETEVIQKVMTKSETDNEVESEYEEEVEAEKEETNEKQQSVEQTVEKLVAQTETEGPPKEEQAEVREIQVEVKVENDAPADEAPKQAEDKVEITTQQEIKIPLREPSIPLEKVEDVEIKPIGPASEIIKKTHTEIISSTTDNPLGALSTQTEYNRIENIVTVNRTLKTLDHTYDNLTQEAIPKIPAYLSSNTDRTLASPLPTRPYQSVFTPEPQSERRHSLLLERLSMERQLPTDVYQNNYQPSNQIYDQQTQEPQSEVLTVSNIKPSSISRERQDWYQQTKRENVYSNNVLSTPPVAPQQTSPSPIWNQGQTRPLLTPQPQAQPILQPQPKYQPTYSDISQDRSTSFQQNTYQQSNSYQQNSYTTPTYTSQPVWGNNNVTNTEPLTNINTPAPYSYQTTDTTDRYQNTTQQYSSSYVPPPWEQDTSYLVDNSNQNYYQTAPPVNTYTPPQSWKPTPPPSKFSKPVPKAYIPPAPNQSFVKPVTNLEPPKTPGRKTYYSEYERRYISVPEATYIPGESKFQPQPDPSPQYYYDNNEPAEIVEPQWRKELREFTEKTSLTQTESTSVKPPWEAEPKYAKATPTTYTPMPTWSQTLRPRSWRERSYDAEYIGSQEWPKTNTLGRGRPLSSVYKNVDAPIPERTRGVSVDRYNPNNYQSPITAEHPPVQTHILTTPTPHAGYHNPNVPTYHARASAEPREQPHYPQQVRSVREARASPLQSRSFKYLQWITGTED